MKPGGGGGRFHLRSSGKNCQSCPGMFLFSQKPLQRHRTHLLLWRNKTDYFSSLGFGECVCKSTLVAAIINISSCKSSAKQVWAKQSEFLSFDHLRFPLEEASPGAGPGRVPQPRAAQRFPRNTRPPPSRLSTFVLFTNMLPEFQWVIYSVAPSMFPPRPCRRLTQGPAPNLRRKDQSKKILFNFFFFFFFLRFHSFLSLSPPGLLPSPVPSLPPASSSSFTPFCYKIAQIEAQEGPIGNA